MIEGISVTINGDVQAAIDHAGSRYREKNGLPPTHVCLPGGADTTGLYLYTLTLGPPTSRGATITRHTGTVLVGRLVGESPRDDGWQQLRLV